MKQQEYEAMASKVDNYVPLPQEPHGTWPEWEDATNSGAAPAHSTRATGRNDAWPELQPLIAQTEAQDYPLDALPPLIRGAVDGSVRVCQSARAPGGHERTGSAIGGHPSPP
jgi:hypothetical protein